MEDADQILLTSLRQAGCAVRDDATSLRDLSTGDMVAICQQSVRQIEGSGKGDAVNTVLQGLPNDTAARFRVCAGLAVKMQQLGYRGELSFQQFLYPSESDTRDLVRFLVEKLASNHSSASGARSGGRVASRFLSALNSNGATSAPLPGGKHAGGKLVVPHRSQPLAIGMNKQKGIYVFGSKGFAGVRPQHVPGGTESAGVDEAQKGVEDMRLGDGVVEERGEGDAEMLALQERHDSGVVALNGLQDRMGELELEYRRLGEEAEALDEETVRLEEEYLLRKETAGAVIERGENAEELAEELQRSIDKARKRRRGLEEEWAAFAGPLEAERDELRGVGGTEREAIKAREEEIRLLRAECRELEADVFEKEAQQDALLAELERAPRGAPGATYVRRISDVVKQVRKQDADIAKIVADIRDLQRQNNTEQDKLRRTYALVDEKIFREARRDAACKAAYRVLCSIHQSFGDLVEATTERDRVSREVTEMEAKVRSLQRRKLDPAKVDEDLRTIEKQNQGLEGQLNGDTAERRELSGPS